MKLVTQITTTSPSELEYFPELKMEVTKDGVEVYARAPLFAEWIKNSQIIHKEDQEAPPTWTKAGVGKFYYPLESWAYSRPNAFAAQNSWGLFADERVNMIWLFNCSLATGATTLLKGAVSANNFEDYFESCCRSVQEFYVRELRRAAISVCFKEILQP